MSGRKQAISSGGPRKIEHIAYQLPKVERLNYGGIIARQLEDPGASQPESHDGAPSHEIEAVISSPSFDEGNLYDRQVTRSHAYKELSQRPSDVLRPSYDEGVVEQRFNFYARAAH